MDQRQETLNTKSSPTQFWRRFSAVTALVLACGGGAWLVYDERPWMIDDNGTSTLSTELGGLATVSCGDTLCKVIQIRGDCRTYELPRGGLGTICDDPAFLEPPPPPSATAPAPKPTPELPALMDAKELLELGLERARAIESHAILTHSSFNGLNQGLVDTMQKSAATMRFAYAYLDRARPPGADIVRGEIRARVDGGRLSLTETTPPVSEVKPGQATHLPTCSSSDAWAAAKASGMPEDAIARLTYWATWSNGGGWWFTVDGHDELRRDVDPRTCQVRGWPGAKTPSPKHVSKAGAAAPTAGPRQPIRSESDALADAACDSADDLAVAGDIAKALVQYRTCAGPGGPRALDAIDAAAVREVNARGCSAMSTASQAARIGATSACKALPTSCGGKCAPFVILRNGSSSEIADPWK